MDRSLKAALYFGVLVCLLRVFTHAAQAALPLTASAKSISDGHIDDAVGYGILALIICFAIFRIRPRK